MMGWFLIVSIFKLFVLTNGIGKQFRVSHERRRGKEKISSINLAGSTNKKKLNGIFNPPPH